MHFAKICRGKPSRPKGVSATLWPTTLTSVGAPEARKRSIATVVVNSDWRVEALFDTGSNESYIHPSLVDVPAIPVHSSASMVSTAT